jgi:hypothetical protein
LRLERSTLVAIPGNHDKLIQPDLEIYHTHLSETLELPHQPLPRSCYVISRTARHLEFVFFLVEASIYVEVANTIPFGTLDHFARGTIDPALRDEVRSKVDRLRTDLAVDAARIADFDKALKIVLVHYAPICRGATLPEEVVGFLRCDGLEALVVEVSADVDLVIHGHLHESGRYAVGHAQVVKVGTATQWRAAENGFDVLKVWASGRITIDHHVWNGRGFDLEYEVVLRPAS